MENPMNVEQMQDVLREIDEWLEHCWPHVEPKKVDGDWLLYNALAFISDETMIAHLKYMVIEMSVMNNFEPDDSLTREKLMRWLGFLQGALWARGYFSLDNFREMNVVEK